MRQLLSLTSIVPELTVDAKGIGRSTIRGAARIGGVDVSSLSVSLASSVGLSPSKLATMLMSQGFDGVGISLLTSEDLKPTKLVEMLIQQGFAGEGVSRFAQDGIPDRALAIIVEYYAFEAGRDRL